MIALNLPEVNEMLEKAHLLDEMLSSPMIAPVERALFDSIVASLPKADIYRVSKASGNSGISKTGLVFLALLAQAQLAQ
jgi:hypothetical protein